MSPFKIGDKVRQTGTIAFAQFAHEIGIVVAVAKQEDAYFNVVVTFLSNPVDADGHFWLFNKGELALAHAPAVQCPTHLANEED